MTEEGIKWLNWGDHPFVVFIALLTGAITIVAFLTGKGDLPSILRELDSRWSNWKAYSSLIFVLLSVIIVVVFLVGKKELPFLSGFDKDIPYPTVTATMKFNEPSPTVTSTQETKPSVMSTRTPIPTATYTQRVPTLTPTPSWYMYVVGEYPSISLRDCPSLACDILGGVPKGDAVLTNGKTQYNTDDEILWYQVVYHEITYDMAWMSGNYLDRVPPSGYPTATRDKISQIETATSSSSSELSNTVTLTPPSPTQTHNESIQSESIQIAESDTMSGFFKTLGSGICIGAILMMALVVYAVVEM